MRTARLAQTIASTLRRPALQGPMRVLACASWVVIAVLSLVPGQDRPHTGASGNVEHALAYALAAFVTRLAFRRTKTRWQLAGYSIAAAAFEIAQIWIPGRSAGVDNWAASTAGALIGLVAARELAHLR